MLSKETEPTGYIERDIYKRRFIIGIGSHGMETKKPQDLPYASWRAKEVHDIIQSEFQGLRTGGMIV